MRRILILAAMILAGCVASRPSDPAMEADALAFRADPDSAAVYFLRRQQLAGAITPWSVLVDGQFVASILNDEYTLVRLDPGTHDVVYNSGLLTGGKRITVAGGEILFYRIGMDMGWTANRMVIETVDRRIGMEEVKELAFIPPE